MINEIFNNILYLTDFDLLFFLAFFLLIAIFIGVLYNLEN
jgi:hypothetical protein